MLYRGIASGVEPDRPVQRTMSAKRSLIATGFLADLPLLVDDSHPNGLLIGSNDTTNRLLRALDGFWAAPVRHSPPDGQPWSCDERSATWVIHDLDALDEADQRQLLAWMDGAGRDAQVIALAVVPVYPLVERGVFSERLYYRLNEIYIDATAVESGGQADRPSQSR
jgi:hypothetical protein